MLGAQALLDQALENAERILLICRELPTFFCEEDQALKLVPRKIRNLNLDPTRFCGPMLDRAAHLHQRFFTGDLGKVNRVDLVLRLSTFLDMRLRRPPFDDFDYNDANTVIDQLLHEIIHGGKSRLFFLDDVNDAACPRSVRGVGTSETVAYFHPNLFVRRVTGTHHCRYLTQTCHPTVAPGIAKAERLLHSLQRRASEFDQRTTSIAILELLRYPRRKPIGGEPEILWRIRRLLGRPPTN